MWICLEPEDVLLFRDSRPFAAGEEHRAQGHFPPHPATILGALRSRLLQTALGQCGKTFADYAEGDPALTGLINQFGGPDDTGALRLRGPLVYRFAPGTERGDPIFPQPADLIQRYVPAPMAQAPGGFRHAWSGMPAETDFHLLLYEGNRADTPEQKTEEGWYTVKAITRYLQGCPTMASDKEEEVITEGPVVTEERTGIKRDNVSRTAQTGMLYEARMNRPQWKRDAAFGLLIDLTGAELTAGCLPLGGEMRSVWARPCTLSPEFQSLLNGDARDKIVQFIVEQEGRFRLYLLTPGLFRGGWLPALFDKEKRPTALRLVAAATGKPVPVGGWDLARRAPRPLHRAVPAGGVYFGQLDDASEGSVRHFVETYHFTTQLQAQETDIVPSNGGQDSLPASWFAQAGFGLTLVGGWKSTAI